MLLTFLLKIDLLQVKLFLLIVVKVNTRYNGRKGMKKYLGIVLKESIKKDGFIIPTNKWKDKIKIEKNLIKKS